MSASRSDSSQTDSLDVALVSMPWAPATEPCLGLSILKKSLADAGITSKVYHLAPLLLEWCSIETYTFLSELWAFNEFLFTGIVDGRPDDLQQESLQQQAAVYSRMSTDVRYQTPKDMIKLAVQMRERIVPEFVERCLKLVLERRPKLVGFTCSFDQTMASLALASRIRALAPSVPIIFGGYALEGPPGEAITRTFPYVDLVINGDGETAIVEVARDVMRGQSPSTAHKGAKLVRAPLIDLEKSPVPDFDDWFDGVARLSSECKITIHSKTLPVESSRGCWWGQQQHCVFCGIDEDSLKYRRKSAATTLSTLAELRARYGDYIFRFSDYIMPKEYYTELLPELARQPAKYRLHSEIKANHPPERVQALSEAGFLELQPGIESFSTPVLKSMHKGVTSIQNVSLLKAGYRFGVIINYNILFGLPSDRVEDYREMLRMVPMLYHLTPPVTCTDTAITRFAPLEASPLDFGLSARHVHHERYDILFSGRFLEGGAFSLDSYAYYFSRNFEYSDDLEKMYRQLSHQVEYWKALHRERFAELSYEASGDQLLVLDSRFSQSRQYLLSPIASAVYLACDGAPVGRKRMRERLAEGGTRLTDDNLNQAMDELLDNRLVWTEGNLILGLALPGSISEDRKASNWCRSWMSIWR